MSGPDDDLPDALRAIVHCDGGTLTILAAEGPGQVRIGLQVEGQPARRWVGVPIRDVDDLIDCIEWARAKAAGEPVPYDPARNRLLGLIPQGDPEEP